ncbi:MAG: M13 family metallopeptidase [Candidatus Promineifilaceae bacterium]|nr:M13 family metallopeptidase [Candidatus Promineifilaceae bacterium]
MNQPTFFKKYGIVSRMASVPKHPHHDDKHSRHAADLSHHVQRLGFSIDNIDPTADPRQDFYRFAAGGWLDQAVIPDEDAQIGGFIGLFHLLNEQILALLQDAAENSADEPPGTVVQQVGDFYASAMDVERLEALGFDPLQPELARIEDIANITDLAGVLPHLTLISGKPLLLTPAVIPDRTRSDMNQLQLYPGQLSLPQRDFYVNEAFAPVLEAFVAHIIEMLELAGVASEDAASQAQAILYLEKALAAATLSPVEAADPAAQYHKMAVSDLLPLAPLFDFDAYFAGLDLSLDGEINIAEPKYIEALNGLLAERPLDDFKHYLRWRLINALSTFLSPAIAERTLDFFMKKLQGKSKLMPREKRVASQLQHDFGHPVAQLYVREYFSEETKTQVEEIVSHVKAQFKSRLETNPWLDDPTRSFALEKLDRMQINVGYPEKWVDYSSLQIRRDDYLGNQMRLSQFDIKRNLAKRGQPVVTEEFNIGGSTLPTDINAAYQPQANKIEICAAILQPPFFYPDLDMAVNYGAIGAVIGHEITHGFDSIGRRFDARGNMTDWWTPGDSEEFSEMTGMLVEQFNGYEVLPDLYCNGQLTVTENTADLGGVTLAFEALREALANEPAEEIDGYTPEQRFFISWAQLWMSKTRPEILQQLINADPHAPSAFRTTGALVNLDAFFETFDIHPGDAMWREEADRVVIW